MGTGKPIKGVVLTDSPAPQGTAGAARGGRAGSSVPGGAGIVRQLLCTGSPVLGERAVPTGTCGRARHRTEGRMRTEGSGHRKGHERARDQGLVTRTRPVNVRVGPQGKIEKGPRTSVVCATSGVWMGRHCTLLKLFVKSWAGMFSDSGCTGPGPPRVVSALPVASPPGSVLLPSPHV